MKIKLGVLLASFLSLLTSCQKSDKQTQASDASYQVAATIGMIADLASVIGGDHIHVDTIIGAGADPHVYKHTAKDVKLIKGADLVLYNGFHLEGKMDSVLGKMQEQGLNVHAVAEAVIDKGTLLKDEEGAEDPHLWMDVSEWRKVAQHVLKTLSTEDLAPHHAEFESNYQALDQQLEALNLYAKKSLSSIPERQRQLITAHDAFGYMERAYGLKVRGIQGLSTESEAGLKDIENLVSFIKKKKIPAIFVESSVSDKNVKALIEGCNAQNHQVTIGGELFSDAMGTAGTYEGTYLGMMDHNITTITNALGGQAPKEGCFGKLSH